MSIIITLGRQKGSGGLDVGQRAAKLLDIPCYDKELVEMAAEKSNLSPEALKNADERAGSSFLYSIVNGGVSFHGMHSAAPYDMPINDKLFLAQSEVIKEAARKGSCVIVGRSSDYVLKDQRNIKTLNVFIYGSLEYRVKRIMDSTGLSAAKAKEMALKTDKRRKSYYEYYTGCDWGAMGNYDICLNSEVLGIEGAADIIVKYVKENM